MPPLLSQVHHPGPLHGNELSVADVECAKRQQAEESEKEKDELKTKLADSHNQLVLTEKCET